MSNSSPQILKRSFSFFAGLATSVFLEVVKLLRNVKFAVTEIAVISFFTIIGSTIPQGQEPETYISLCGQRLGNLILTLGLNNVFYTLWFNCLLLLLSTSILACLCHRYRPTWRKFGFLVTHSGLLLIGVGALATGLYGFHGRMIVHEGESSSRFLDNKMILQPLPFAVVCERFWIDHYDSGNGSLIVYQPNGHYEKRIQADPGNSLYSEANNAAIRVLEILPDFVMDDAENRPATRSNKWRNPAALVEVERGGSTEREILFYLQPMLRINPKLRDIVMHYSRDPQSLNVKSYNSTLRVIEDGQVVMQKTIVVNDPLRYKGYTFYQSSWDQERESYTVLEVKKDPGEEIFYIGGSLVMLGVVVIFYVNPLLRRRFTSRA